MKMFLARQPVRPSRLASRFKHFINSTGVTDRNNNSYNPHANPFESRAAHAREFDHPLFPFLSFAPWSDYYLRYLVSSQVQKEEARVARDAGFVLEHLARRRRRAARRDGKNGVTRSIECSVHEWINNVGYRGGGGWKLRAGAHLARYEWPQGAPPS